MIYPILFLNIFKILTYILRYYKLLYVIINYYALFYLNVMHPQAP